MGGVGTRGLWSGERPAIQVHQQVVDRGSPIGFLWFASPADELTQEHPWMGKKPLPTKPTQTENAVDFIRSRIIDLTLPPGSRIDEAVLVNKFRLGRTPAREALNWLAAEGFVHILQNRGGTLVRALDLTEIRQILQAYHLSEIILGQLSNFDDTRLVSDLETIQSMHEKAVKDNNFLDITKFNVMFHMRLYNTIENEYIVKFVKSTHDHTRRLTVLLYTVESKDQKFLDEQLKLAVEQHRMIIEAVKSGDRARLRDVLSVHSGYLQIRLARLMEVGRSTSIRVDPGAMTLDAGTDLFGLPDSLKAAPETS